MNSRRLSAEVGGACSAHTVAWALLEERVEEEPIDARFTGELT
jgi:hypothetical protein